MSTPLTLPITPTSPSLPSHLTALSLLSLHLANLPSTPSLSARIPLTSKASLVGDITRTDETLVCLGAGDGAAGGGGEGSLWVKMSAGEARGYVERRKEWVLQREASARDGLPFASLGTVEPEKEVKEEVLRPFHPLFLNPALAGPSRSQREAEAAVVEAMGRRVVEERKAKPDIRAEPPTPPEQEAKGKAPASAPTSVAAPSRAASTKSASPADEGADAGDDLIEIMSEGVITSGKSSAHPTSLGDNTVLNDEGLPIHDIRETLDGQTIGPPPPANEASMVESEIGEGQDTYWSEEAVKRREVLRRKIFAEGSDSEEEEEVALAAPSPAPTPAVHASEPKPTVTTTEPSSPPVPPPHGILHHPSSSTSPSLPPKSILKPLATRKKSVTFDPSIPVSPDSPNLSHPHTHGGPSQRFGFPLPLAVQDDEPWKPKPVPVLAVPEPGKKGKGKDEGFAGLRRGFLGAPQSVQRVKPQETKPAEVTPVASLAPASAPAHQPPVDGPKPKKKSLFAQRLAHSEIDASAPATSSSTPATASPRIPSLPRASEAKGSSTVKPAVVEKSLLTQGAGAGTRGRGTGEGTAGLKSAVVERDAPTPPSAAPIPATAPARHPLDPTPDGYADEDDSEDLSSDDDLSELSSDEEDEYDLDDALLAREVALAYHQRRAYLPVNRDPDDPDGDWGEENMGMRGPGGDEAGAGVLLGLPRIGDLEAGQGGEGQGPVIINPTPDDLRRFVRVGRLENGNLVLAPGQEGMLDTSDEEGDEEPTQGEGEEAKEVRERRKEVKRRRDEVRRQLMVGEGEKKVEKKVEPDDRWKSTIPPALATAVTETPVAAPAPAPAPPQPKAEEPAADPKKVSRFKAARMAGGQ